MFKAAQDRKENEQRFIKEELDVVRTITARLNADDTSMRTP